MDLDFAQIYSKGLAKAKRLGLNNEEQQDFAQEYALKSFEKGKYLKLDWFAANYADEFRTDKRKLSHTNKSFGSAVGISLDAPVDDSNADSTRFGDIIGGTFYDIQLNGELSELNWTVNELLRNCSSETREWALKQYGAYIKNRI